MRSKLGALGSLMAALFPLSVSAQVPRIDLAYGSDPLQRIDFYRPEGEAAVPVILFVHGGGWVGGSKSIGARMQPGHFLGKGFAWASMDYRLVPAATVEQQAADVAHAIAWLKAQAQVYGIDPDRIVLMGHSAGAHLTALVATDPQWLAAEGLSPDMLRAVITLDGAGLDLVTAMMLGKGASHYHMLAFGNDVERQARLSPIRYADVLRVSYWLLLHDADNDPSRGRFAQALADVLEGGGAYARVVGINGSAHMRMIWELGGEDDGSTIAVDAFLDEVLAQ